MDRARQKTDRILNDMERRISRVYAESPALRRIQKKYEQYMSEVESSTESAYRAYKNAANDAERESLKKVYTDEVKRLTINNKQYRLIVSEFTRTMAEVNQQALDIVNAEMTGIYMLNYNQLAVDCRKMGIKVMDNG